MVKNNGYNLLIQYSDLEFIKNNAHIISSIPKCIDSYLNNPNNMGVDFIEITDLDLKVMLKNLPFIVDFNEYNKLEINELENRLYFYKHQLNEYEREFDKYMDFMSAYDAERKVPNFVFIQYIIKQINSIIKDKKDTNSLQLKH